MNDLALRSIVIGLGGNTIPRETGFDLTSASEVMAALALASSLTDLRRRLGRIVIGYTHQDLPVFAEDIRAAGAMAILLKDAIKPNLLQTIEHVPALVHAGPFANIAHGNSSVLADQVALRCCDVVVTEAGFGADMGFEKFCHIKCRASGLKPDVAVMVVTVRAVKAHSGRYRVIPGRPVDPRLFKPDVEALREGLPNLQKHLENIAKFGLPCVVAVNHFPTDSDEEIETLVAEAREAGAFDAVVSEVHTGGGEGGKALAASVMRAAESPGKKFRYLYDVKWTIPEKIETIAREIYGADGVEYAKVAQTQIENFTHLGYADLPICMAKTQYSLSHDPALRGRPTGFTLPVREVRLAGGAEFLAPLCGLVQTMPAFGRQPAAINMDIDERGRVRGMF